MWRLGLIAALLGLFAVAPTAAEGRPRSTIPTFTRPMGAPARIVWSARVPTGLSGDFQLYRISGGDQHEVARLAGQTGLHGYRWVDRGSVDASAIYELRWSSSTDGATVVLGRLHCERESTCQPLASPAAHTTTALELTSTNAPRLAPGSAARAELFLADPEGRAGPSPADPPPWHRRDAIR